MMPVPTNKNKNETEKKCKEGWPKVNRRIPNITGNPSGGGQELLFQ
jgi:hypothetical protein